MRISDQQILKAVRAGLKRLATELTDQSSAHLLSAINIAVTELAARGGDRTESVRASCVEARRLAERAAALVAKVDADTVSPRLQALQEAGTNDLETLDTFYVSIKQLLVESTLALGRANNTDAAWHREVATFFHDLARHEAERAGLDLAAPEVETESDSKAPLDQYLRIYLARCQGSGRLTGPFQLENLRLLSGGFSRQTMLAQVRDASGEERSLVIRKQIPGGFLEGACNTLAEEKPFLRLTHEAGLAVPELYWHETDSAILGGEFFVTECMAGTTIGSSYQMAEGIGDAFFKQLAEMMATLHCIDWTPFAEELRAASRIPAGAVADCGQAALAMVGQFEDYWRHAKLEPLPTMELLVDWLQRNVPRGERRAVLCHGDIGFHNMLVQNGRISALLDWETSRLADPARDLAYMRPMATQYVDWQRFMGWYRDAGGPEVDDATLDYYAVFAAFAHVLVCEVAIGDSFPRAARPNLEYLRLGRPVKAYFLNELLHTCAPVWGAGKQSSP